MVTTLGPSKGEAAKWHLEDVLLGKHSNDKNTAVNDLLQACQLNFYLPWVLVRLRVAAILAPFLAWFLALSSPLLRRPNKRAPTLMEPSCCWCDVLWWAHRLPAWLSFDDERCKVDCESCQSVKGFVKKGTRIVRQMADGHFCFYRKQVCSINHYSFNICPRLMCTMLHIRRHRASKPHCRPNYVNWLLCVPMCDYTLPIEGLNCNTIREALVCSSLLLEIRFWHACRV